MKFTKGVKVPATLVVAVIVSIVLVINVCYIFRLNAQLNQCENNMTELYKDIKDLNTQMKETNDKIQKVSDDLSN